MQKIRMLKYLQRRLKLQPTTMLEYHCMMRDQLRNGIIEHVPEEGKANKATDRPVHYMPHHPVIRQDKRYASFMMAQPHLKIVSTSWVKLNSQVVQCPHPISMSSHCLGW